MKILLIGSNDDMSAEQCVMAVPDNYRDFWLEDILKAAEEAGIHKPLILSEAKTEDDSAFGYYTAYVG